MATLFNQSTSKDLQLREADVAIIIFGDEWLVRTMVMVVAVIMVVIVSMIVVVFARLCFIAVISYEANTKDTGDDRGEETDDRPNNRHDDPERRHS